jgi:hypothetical protein
MIKKHANFLLALAASVIVGCATVGGAIYGAGVGYILGDAEMGAAIDCAS